MAADAEGHESTGVVQRKEKSLRSPSSPLAECTSNRNDLPSGDSPSLNSSRNANSWVTISVALNVLLLSAVLHLYHRVQPSTGTLQGEVDLLSATPKTVVDEDPCSGHGTFVAKYRGGTCRCHSCFIGKDCSRTDHGCVLDFDVGDPTMFEKYWLGNLNSGTTVIKAWQYTSYRGNSEKFPHMMDELEEAIRSVHELVGNAVTEGRHVVVGTGSTQLFQAALYALSSQTRSTPTNVVSAAPYYSAHRTQSNYIRSELYRWAGDAASYVQDVNYDDDGANYIEVVTTPSNPTGEIRYPLVRGTGGALVYDLAYYWPHFTPITASTDEDIMLFSLSKCTGHAGSRIGWAIVKDLKVAKKMMYYLLMTGIGISKESQVRANQLLRSVLEGYSKGKYVRYIPPVRASSGEVPGVFVAEAQPLFHYSAWELAYRWERLRSALKGGVHLSLLEFQPASCTFFGEMRTPAPAFAWIRCTRDEDCTGFLKGHGILARDGGEFGVEARFARLSMVDRGSSFEIFISRLETVESQLSGPS